MDSQFDARVRRIVGRLSRAVPILVEAEFTAFVKLIESDTRLTALLNSLVEREGQILEPFIHEFATAHPAVENVRLHFADTLEIQCGIQIVHNRLNEHIDELLDVASMTHLAFARFRIFISEVAKPISCLGQFPYWLKQKFPHS